jgi:hypothetical protein
VEVEAKALLQRADEPTRRVLQREPPHRFREIHREFEGKA